MKKSHQLIAMALLFGVVVQSAFGQTNSSRKRSKGQSTAVVTSQSPLPIVTSGDAKILVQYINPLHYQYSLQVSSTNINAPTAPAAIAPSASTTGSLPPPPQQELGPTQSTQTPRPPTADEQWKQIVANERDAREQVFGLKQQTDRLLFAALTEQQCYKDRLSFYSSYLLDVSTANSLKEFALANQNPVTSQTGNSATDSCRRPDDQWPYIDL